MPEYNLARIKWGLYVDESLVTAASKEQVGVAQFLYERTVDEHVQLFEQFPLNGYRGDTSIRKRIEYDIYYIENWTLGFDVKICFLTIFKGFINKNAY